MTRLVKSYVYWSHSLQITKLIAIHHKRIDTKTTNLNVIYVEKFIGKNIISKDIWSFSIKLMTCVKLKRVSKKQWMQILVSQLVKKSSSIPSRFLQKDSEQQTSKLRKGAEHKICSPLETSQWNNADKKPNSVYC